MAEHPARYAPFTIAGYDAAMSRRRLVLAYAVFLVACGLVTAADLLVARPDRRAWTVGAASSKLARVADAGE